MQFIQNSKKLIIKYAVERKENIKYKHLQLVYKTINGNIFLMLIFSIQYNQLNKMSNSLSSSNYVYIFSSI